MIVAEVNPSHCESGAFIDAIVKFLLRRNP